MAQNFLRCDREQSFLLPPSVAEWLPADHLGWFVIEVVEELELAVFYERYRDDGRGGAAYDPRVMVALCLYAYSVGVRSSRQIERRCYEDVAFRVICANRTPDHATIARFRADHEEALSGLFGQVLGLCVRAEIVSPVLVAVDSTKIAANASGLANRDLERLAREVLEEAAAADAAEDELYGDRRGDELPPELANPKTRRARVRELMGELQAEQEERERMLERRAEHERRTGRRPLGRPPVQRPKQTRSRLVNVTDPDSRPVKTPHGFIQGYNAHAVAAEGQIIVAAEVTTGSGDQGHLEPMVAAARAELAAVGSDDPEVVLADAGYWTGGQITAIEADGIQVLVPPDAHTRATPNPKRRGGLYKQMRDRLKTDQGGALYKRRMTMIEPIFGQTKTNRRADRFQRRGLPAVRSEWRLLAATHNLLKLWRATTAPATA